MNKQTQNEYPDWLQAVIREARLRKALILHGNVRDIYYDPKQRQYVTLAELLLRILPRENTFTLAGQWDQADGLRFHNEAMLQQFQDCLDGRDCATAAAQAYDLDEADPEEPQQTEGLYPDPTELMPAMRTVFSSPTEKPLFVLSGCQLLVNQPAHPDERERNWILQALNAILGPPVVALSGDALQEQQGLFIFVTTQLGRIPPLLYQNDPRIRTMSIPPPSRPERRDFFMRHHDDLQCRQPKTDDPVMPTGAGSPGRGELATALADLTDQLKLIDLRQVLMLSQQTPEPLTAESLVNLYRLGDQRSPWEELNADKLGQVEDLLKKRVVGQDLAVDHVATMIIRAYMGLAGLQHSGKQSKPKGILFFVGPTGVGKTELAKATAEFLFGDESACIRFDMSEYNHEHSDQRLIGAPPGYVGYEEGGQLTNAIRQRPFSVLLFDEIEKAHGRVLDKFLQILEDGRLTDGRGETTQFSECVIIFTSNIGAAAMPKTDDPELIQRHFIREVEHHFVQELNRPELLNRLGDNIVVFNKITNPSFRHAILERKLEPLRSHLRERYGVGLQFPEEIQTWLLELTRADHGGRGVINVMERELINPLARFLFTRTHQLQKGRQIVINRQENHLTMELTEESS